MVLPALSKPRRRTEYSAVLRGQIISDEPSGLKKIACFTFFAGRVGVQRLGQVIHDREIKTDATEIAAPSES